ncbi:MAG: flippase-like domain-containing protein [Proteobacteria bacterium]|nr:flippase-like domain-containing protein [Pseudomonadota bacterium]
MKKNRFSAENLKKAERWIIVLIALTVGITLLVTVLASKKSLGDDLYDLPLGAIGWLVLATLFENLPRFWRYHLAGKTLKLGVPWHRMLYYHTVGYGLIPTPGKVGVVIRLWLLKQYHKLPYQRTAPLLVMDLISDSIAMFGLATAALLVIDDPRLKLLGFVMGLALAGSLVLTLGAPRYLRIFIKLAYRLTGRRFKKLFARLLGIIHTARDVLGWQVIVTTTVLSLVAWLPVCWAIANLLSAMGYPLTMAEGTLALTLSTIGGFLTMLPAGVGGTEVTMAGIFTLFAVPLAEAVLATAIIRLIILWMVVLIGLALLPFAMRNAPKRSN